ncbi:hypothetical protein [Burkholderia cenocepacia]|uniref:hypothetical protein n=1 Tax=Burkholderia cenocepacia TaxID=95486 RepID=UPI001589B51A|nr:hypothetical protein [Burkholderia cenocepacia]
MRLDFNILWVEDQQGAVQAQREKIERLVRAEGFRLRVQFATSVDEATHYLSDDIFGDHVDLILMDYNLGSGPNGDRGLQEVRRLLPYKDVVFYSAQANNLRTILEKAEVEGIYLSNREDLPDAAHGIFNTLIKKVLDIDHSRGLVMGATSDIDHFVNDCLVLMFDSSDEATQKAILELVINRVAEIKERFDTTTEEICALKHVKDLFENHAVYTSTDRTNLLRKTLKIHGKQLEIEKEIAKYVSNVVPKRNTLAHVRVVIEGFSRKLINNKGEELTNDEMRDLRILLLKNQEMFEELHRALSQTQS